MELTDDNLLTLSEYLKHTLSPDINVRRPAEKFLESVEVNQNYPLLLLHLVDKSEINITIRIAGAVAFKNYIKRNWKVGEDSVDRIHAQDREAIKKLIVNLMLHSPDSVQKQLSDAVSIVGKYDFPNKWPELIDQMVEKFNTGDFHVINGVLHTAHSLFKKYRYEFKSQTLWTEIKFVLDRFAKPLTDLFVATMNLMQVHANNIDALKIIYSSLVILSKVFYSLNFQDLPEFFEDNMAIWMRNFHILLNTDVPSLQSTDEEEAGVIEQLKSQVCDNIGLYAQKYDEEFQPYLPEFVTAVWNLLTSTGQQPKYDTLVSNALQFLATVADRAQYRHLFEDPTTLSSICEKVIIPNMEFRESDNELFEDNPEEYIRRDIEGSDVDTRRRAACDLVKVLSKYFEAKIMEIFGAYIQVMLQNYANKPAENWRSKDAAIYLVTSSASKAQTQKHGVTQSSELVPLPQFAMQHIEPELIKPNVNEFPVLKADAIKFIMTFRSILPKEMIIGSLPQLIRHLSASNIVVHTYAACAIEKILAMKGPDNLFLVKANDLSPLTSDLLKGLFACLNISGSEENEYVMKAIMRSFGILQEIIVPFLADLLPKLTEKLAMVSKNPSRPNFNHYLFETFALSIKIVCKTHKVAVSSFEEALFPIFQEILQQDVLEFLPYLFQILALLLELRTTQDIPEAYLALFPCLLSSVLFERQANIHPLNRLLRAFISHGAHHIVAQDKTNGLLGVFQKLIASKANDHEGFLLLQSIIEYFAPNVLEPYMKQIFVLLFQRLSSSKTTKFVKGLIVFFAYYIIRYGSNNLVTIIDQIQSRMFGMVVERVLIADMQKITGDIERKVTAVGMSNLLIDCPAMLERPYNTYYPRLLATLVEFFELPQDQTSLPEDTILPETEDTPGYQVGYSQLLCARNPPKDPLEAIGDVRLHLAQGLARLSPRQLLSILDQIPEPNANHLRSYLQTVGITVA
ncbi:exportin-2 [Apis mellifera caucasica]|uniref:Exportin-2 n=1 Tax=Apis mellifera TaxID=7460 RepID=A0A7M7R5K2_APIME|nr:exportin-2 [Apis mellifera]KAG6796722.1 exportin-2 [Apis mellifera caucasica]KAG9436488.1 exportin-2 [Apis mellifera carnica]|eukprot:XP_395332.2 exportin-2 [Apis mellifera]